LGPDRAAGTRAFHVGLDARRVQDIIVDKELRLRGFIDWEFVVTIPRRVFLPPPWLSGHDTLSDYFKLDLSSEFRSVLLFRARNDSSPNYSELAEDWGVQDNLKSAIARIFLDPSTLVQRFFQDIFPRLYNKSPHTVVHAFFQQSENKAAKCGLLRRLYDSKQYTQYLKDHGILNEEMEARNQRMRKSNQEAKQKARQIRESAGITKADFEKWGIPEQW
jgi:hypothetical protein